MSRALKILLVHPGAATSVHDVYEGLAYGLKAHGVEVIPYGLYGRIRSARDYMHALWRKAKDQGLQKPGWPDILYHASTGALERAVRHEVDLVLAVSGFFLHPDALVLLRRAKVRTGVIFTESPYATTDEVKIAQYIDAAWTMERASVGAFARVCPRVHYLAHAWHPLKHSPSLPLSDVAAHDVVFVGTGWPERSQFIGAIDWTGINLGIYGPDWRLPKALRACHTKAAVDNARVADLYRAAKIGLNLHRSIMAFSLDPGLPHLAPGVAESANPRAFELAACGAFHLSDARAEVIERFGDAVPTFRTPAEAEALIRSYLADDDARARIQRRLPALVAEDSWLYRAREVIGHIEALVHDRRAA